MTWPRIPAWFYPLGASFILYFAVATYCRAFPTEPIGVRLQHEAQGAPLVTGVPPGRAGRAGMRTGDRLVELDGWPMQFGLARTSRLLNLDPDHPETAIVERDGRRLSLRLPAPARYFGLFDNGDVLGVFGLGCCLALGLFIAIRRPRDPDALLGAFAEDVRRAPALHPEFVAFFVRNADATTFTTLISIPARSTPTCSAPSRSR